MMHRRHPLIDFCYAPPDPPAREGIELIAGQRFYYCKLPERFHPSGGGWVVFLEGRVRQSFMTGIEIIRNSECFVGTSDQQVLS